MLADFLLISVRTHSYSKLRPERPASLTWVVCTIFPFLLLTVVGSFFHFLFSAQCLSYLIQFPFHVLPVYSGLLTCIAGGCRLILPVLTCQSYLLVFFTALVQCPGVSPTTFVHLCISSPQPLTLTTLFCWRPW